MTNQLPPLPRQRLGLVIHDSSPRDGVAIIQATEMMAAQIAAYCRTGGVIQLQHPPLPLPLLPEGGGEYYYRIYIDTDKYVDVLRWLQLTEQWLKREQQASSILMLAQALATAEQSRLNFGEACPFPDCGRRTIHDGEVSVCEAGHIMGGGSDEIHPQLYGYLTKMMQQMYGI